ncbi:MAG: helix-turn-helix domain-containing protein [Pyrinomonadaceae bacterium]
MQVQFVYPESDTLKNHIEFFSFLQTPGEAEVELLLFPNVVSIMSITPDTELHIDGNEVTVRVNPQIRSIQSDITGRILVPLFFRYLGKCNEICVVFKPLGLEYFFPLTFSGIAPDNYQSFRPPFADWEHFANALFELSSQDLQVAALEDYFLGKFHDAELDQLQEAVSLLIEVESNLSVVEIASLAGFSQKKLERLCRKHLGCSAATFRRIARFRHTINLQLTESKSLDLTSSSHQSNFFDQSHSCKEFRRLSGMSPKEFFNSTWKLPQYGIVWKLK